MGAFTLGALSMIGVPPTCGFFSKWYLIRGGIEAGHWGFVAALVLSSLAIAVVLFRILETAYFGQSVHFPDEERAGQRELPWGRGEGGGQASIMTLVPLLVVAVLILSIGIFNHTFITLIEETVAQFGPIFR